MWRICLTIPIPRGLPVGIAIEKKFCFYIPILVDRFWRRGPQPEPWLILDERPFEFAQDLQILATIADLSRELSPEFGRTLNDGIEQAFSALKKQLPESVELNFHEETLATE